MPKLTYNDKTNTKAVTNRDTQATAEDFNEVKSSVNAIYDGVTDTNIPIKIGAEFVDSPLHWSGVPGENIISDETIEVPPATIQVGEGMKMSAAGVIPIFLSLLTGRRYLPNLVEVDDAGSKTPFTLTVAPELPIIIQPDFSTPVPLTGSFDNVVTETSFINSFGLKTNPGATFINARIQLVAQSTGEAIYYYPSKAKWEDGIGEDLTADGSGNIIIDLSDAPLGLLVDEIITNNYIIDAGIILGDGVDPYQELARQIVEFTRVVTDAPIDGKQYGRQSESWTEIIHEGHYLGVFVDLAALQAAHPTANDGDTATVTTPSANLFYWDGAAWVDTGTGYLGDMLKAVYDPTNIGGDTFSMTNMVEGVDAKIMTLAERNSLGSQSGTNTGDVTLSVDDPTQEGLSLTDQVLTANQATQTTDGLISAEDKTKLDAQSGTNTGDQDLSAFATVAQINNTTGYANYLDSSTDVSPRTYAIDTEQLLINDKAFPDGARYPDGVTSYWDSTANKFTPDQADGNYSFTIDFTADPVSRDKRMIINFVSYDAGGLGVDVVLHSRLVRLQKDDNELTHVSLSFTIGITSAVVANGVSVTLQFEETAADIYDITCGLAKCGAEII